MVKQSIHSVENAPSLIVSDRCKGTVVYNSAGRRIGRIEHVMVDKATGAIVSAVIRIGAGTGAPSGTDCQTVPWSLLVYNPRIEGYETKIALMTL